MSQHPFASITPRTLLRASALFVLVGIFSACGGTGVDQANSRFFASSSGDPKMPRVILLGDNPQVLEAGVDSYFEAGATAMSLLDGDLTAFVQVLGSIDPRKLGTQQMIYRVQDPEGRVAQAERTVTIVDTLAPQLKLIGASQIEIPVSSSFVDPGVTAFDLFEGNLQSQVERETTLNTEVVGTYTMTYRVSDSSGNTAVPVLRTIVVADRVAPVVRILNPASDGLEIGTLNLLVSGTCESGLPVRFEGDVLGMPQASCVAGAFSQTLTLVPTGSGDLRGITIKAVQVDSSQNRGEAVRTLIYDSSLPELSLTAPANGFVVWPGQTSLAVTGTCSEVNYPVRLKAGSVQSTLNCPASRSFSTSLNLSNLPEGSVLLEVSHEDRFSRSVIQTRSGTVVLVQPQILIHQPTYTSVEICGAYQEFGASVDIDGNGTGDVAVTDVTGAVNPLLKGVYVITYRYPLSGNTLVATRTVTVSKNLEGVEFDQGIQTPTEFLSIKSGPTKNYLLCNHLDLQTVAGGVDGSFSGTFHGQGFTISNATIEASSEMEVGLFKRLSGSATVLKLKVERARVIGRRMVGVLAGRAQDQSMIREVEVLDSMATATFGDSDQRLGGLVGLLEDGASVTRAKATEVDLAGGGASVGAIAGLMRGQALIQESLGVGVPENERVLAVSGALENGAEILRSFSQDETLSSCVSTDFGTVCPDALLRDPSSYLGAQWEATLWTFLLGEYPSLKNLRP